MDINSTTFSPRIPYKNKDKKKIFFFYNDSLVCLYTFFCFIFLLPINKNIDNNKQVIKF